MNGQLPADSFVVGFVGLPGDRAFYFQIETEGQVSWYPLEKLQVAGFAAEAARLLAANGLSDVGRHLEVGALLNPETVEFRIGAMQIAYSEAEGLMLLTLRGPDDGSQVTYSLTPVQLDAAVRIASEAVAGDGPSARAAGSPSTPADTRARRPTGTCATTDLDAHGRMATPRGHHRGTFCVGLECHAARDNSR